MRILVDADGCPVVNLTIHSAKKHGLECILFCDTSHYFERDGAKTVTVSQGADSADFKIVNTMQAGDIVVTQDYGLAAMCLAKKGNPINQNGLIYTDENMDSLLSSRHMSQKIRRGGGRTKGPSKRTAVQDEEFIRSLETLIESMIHTGMERVIKND